MWIELNPRRTWLSIWNRPSSDGRLFDKQITCKVNFLSFQIGIHVSFSKLVQMKNTLILLAAVVFTLSSCMTTSTTTGTYLEESGKPYTYAKGRQLWLGFGLIPLGRTDVNAPSDGNCEVISKFTFGDFVISSVTFGIVSSRTIIVKDKQ